MGHRFGLVMMNDLAVSAGTQFWLLVISNLLWIALTAPGLRLLDLASGSGHGGWRGPRAAGCGSHGGRNQAC